MHPAYIKHLTKSEKRDAIIGICQADADKHLDLSGTFEPAGTYNPIDFLITSAARSTPIAVAVSNTHLPAVAKAFKTLLPSFSFAASSALSTLATSVHCAAPFAMV